MAEWVNGWANVAFMDLGCNSDIGGGCHYLDEYYSVAETESREDGYRYAVVVDGDDGDDGRELVEHMNSGKVTLRANIYKKWYDPRLV